MSRIKKNNPPDAATKDNKSPFGKVGKVGKSVHYTVSALRDAFDSARGKTMHGVSTDWAMDMANPVGAIGMGSEIGGALSGRLGFFGGLLLEGSLVASLPGAVAAAKKELRRAVRSGSRDDTVQAVHATASAGKVAVYTIKNLTRFAAIGLKLWSGYHAALEAFKTVAPAVSERVAHAAALSAVKQAFEGATNTLQAAQNVTSNIGHASIAASEAAILTTHQISSGFIGQLAGWLTPGLNIALMLFDTCIAVSTLADRKASVGKKVTACIGAAGSIAAATSIPIVSQAGVAVACTAALVGAFM